MSMLVGPCFDRKDYAGFVRRTLALLIDVFIVCAARTLPLWGWYYLAPAAWVTRGTYGWIELNWWVGVLVYWFGFRFTAHGTPGYRLMRIRYAYVLSSAPPWPAIALRSLAAVFLFWFFALDHFWILFDRRKQAWHDKLSGFYVVKRGAQPKGTRPIVQRIVNILGMTFVFLEPAAGDDR